jgi:hypothetical protein
MKTQLKQNSAVWRPSPIWYAKVFACILAAIIIVYVLFNIFFKLYFRDDIGNNNYFQFITEQK